MNESGIPSIHPKLSDVKDNSEVMEFLESTIRETELAMLEEYERQRKNIAELLKKETHSLDWYFDQDQEMGRRGKEKALLYFNLQSKINQASNQISSEVLKNAIAEGLQRGKQWYNNWEKRENLTLLVFDSIDANIQKIQRLSHSEDLEKELGAQKLFKNTDNCTSDARIEADWDESSKETARKEETNLTGSNSGERINSCIEEAKLQNQNSREDRGEVPIVLEKSNGDADNEERTVWRDEEPVENSRSGIFAENHEEPEDANQLDSSNGDVTQNEEDVKVPDLSRDGHVSCDTKNADSSGSKEIFPSSLEPWEPSLKCADKNGGNDEDKFEGPLLNLDKESDLSIKSGDISIENKEVPLVDNEVSVPQGTCDSICPGSTRKISENSDKDTNPNDTNSSNGSEEQEASKDQEPESLSSSKKPDDENNSESNVSEQFDNTLNNANVSVSSKPDGESAKDDESQSSVSDNQRNPTQNKEENLEISAKEETKSQEEKSTSEKASSKNEEVEDPQDSQPGQANDGSEASESQQEEKKDSSNIQDDSGENTDADASGSDPLETSDETQIAEKSDTSAAREGKQEELKHENEDNDKDGEILGANDGGNNSDGFEEQKKIENEQKTQEGPAEYPKISKENDAPKEASDNQTSEEDAQKALEIVEPDSSTPSEEPLTQNNSVYNTDGIPQDNTENYSKEVDTANAMDQPGNSKYQDAYFEVSYLEVKKLSDNDNQNQDDQDLSGSDETEDKEEDKVPEEDTKDGKCENDGITGSGEHSENSETVEEEKLEDCHNGYDSSNNSDDLKAPNDHESQESNYSLNEKLHQDNNLTKESSQEETLVSELTHNYKKTPEGVKLVNVDLNVSPEADLEANQLGGPGSQRPVEIRWEYLADAKHEDNKNADVKEISNSQDISFSGSNEEGTKADCNQEPWEVGKKYPVIPPKCFENKENTSCVDNFPPKDNDKKNSEGIQDSIQDIKESDSFNEENSKTKKKLDAQNQQQDDQSLEASFDGATDESKEDSSLNINSQSAPTNSLKSSAGNDEGKKEDSSKGFFQSSDLLDNSGHAPGTNNQVLQNVEEENTTEEVYNNVASKPIGDTNGNANDDKSLGAIVEISIEKSTGEDTSERKEAEIESLSKNQSDQDNYGDEELKHTENTDKENENSIDIEPEKKNSKCLTNKNQPSESDDDQNPPKTDKPQSSKPQKEAPNSQRSHSPSKNTSSKTEEVKQYQNNPDDQKRKNNHAPKPQETSKEDSNSKATKDETKSVWNLDPWSAPEESDSQVNGIPEFLANTKESIHNEDGSGSSYHSTNKGKKGNIGPHPGTSDQSQKVLTEVASESASDDQDYVSWNGGEQPQDVSPEGELDYTPFDNEDDCKLPEEEPLIDESAYSFRDRGIENKANNWFMIAILQMLLSIPEFVNYFYFFKFPKKGWRNKPNFDKHPFTRKIQQFLRSVYERNPKLAKIGNLRYLSKGEFTLDFQHDACKYMLHLFECLQNELNPSVPYFVSSGYKNYSEAWMEYSNKHNSIIDELFVGMYETVIICNKCVDETRTYEEFINIPLIIEADKSGSKFLKFFKDQKETSPSEYYCSTCKDITSCKIFKRICKAPKYLMLSIQRFDEFTEQKDNGYVYYPPEFELELPGLKKISYGLKTVVCHSGGLDDGHYLAYCRRGNYWKYWNDSYVYKSDIEEAMNDDAYMLVYKVENFE